MILEGDTVLTNKLLGFMREQNFYAFKSDWDKFIE